MSASNWSEETSRTFIDFGRYFVPEREQQIEAFCDLIPAREQPFAILELCCGEGLLAGALLRRLPSCTVHGFDGSPAMLEHARQRLVSYGERFQTRLFDLTDRSWRTPEWPVHAVVSSLTIHHLDGPGKQLLFQDTAAMLEPGGVFLIADVVEPASPAGVALAAKAWDAAVRQRALEIDGSLEAFEYFEREKWNMYRHPDYDDIDKPSRLLDQLRWLEQAGFADVDVFWMKAGHALFGGRKPS
ncbi:MAG TPA: class I SAM-dependent methyltransferase [Roseiflexaceae bacterium]|nr:class I SAM-dependent methyltransferase [Roseiflexaceae bacterium]